MSRIAPEIVRRVGRCALLLGCLGGLGCLGLGWSVVSTAAGAAQDVDPASVLPADSGISGGLCVQVGARDLTTAAGLAGNGRFLVQVLDADGAAVDRARLELQTLGLYGLASVERLTSPGKLPYAENLVNLLLLTDASAGGRISAVEAARVLCPHGIVIAREDAVSQAEFEAAGLQDVRSIETSGRWRLARKPWPAGMDGWSHPRHGADGNAVSADALVGPPRRIRWVAGPAQEVSNLVSAAGRNFYAGVLARDAFNGLQLWQQTLRPSPARGGFTFQSAAGSVCPVAMGELLLVVTDKQLWALDGATGQPVRAYPAADTPTDVLCLEDTLLTIDDASVRALQPDSGRLRWKVDVAEPRYVSAGDGAVYLIGGSPRRGEKCLAMRLDLATGKTVWQKDDFAWLPDVRRSVYHRGLLAYEISTYSDDKDGNRIEAVSADDARPLWSHTFVPGTAHKKQARAMFVGDLLWVLDDRRCAALDPQTGEVKKTYPAGWGHCFPPVATGQYLFAGEMDMTDLTSGQIDANRITKGNCGRDAGFIPANGLIYVCPKHCICWPMLRGYAALAPARPEDLGQSQRPVLEVGQFTVEKGEAQLNPFFMPCDAPADDWPCYRHDAWRSGSNGARASVRGAPSQWKVLWQAALGDRPQGPIADDWRHNPFVPGPVTPPVIAGSTVFVARGDAHQIVAINADTGATRWTFTANGRIDTAPTIYFDMCLFGTKAGWVYCLRAEDGTMVWRLRAAPLEEQIIAYGQLESPWPVPGSVLVVDGVAYFAAGRQSLADGGILVFAVDPSTGKVQWVRRIDSVPQKHFYGGLGLEFDNFDLLQREGDSVAMSRWLLQRADGQTTVESESGFARLKTGSGEGVMFPRGCWSYAPREETERVKTRPYLRPLAVFRDSTLWSCSEDRRTVFRRDFDLANEPFNTVWSVRGAVQKSGDTSRSQRLARGAKWSVEVLPSAAGGTGIAAMVLAGNMLLVAESQGSLMAMDAEKGAILARHELPSPVWDGLAAAAGRVFLTTSDGQVICVGE